MCDKSLLVSVIVNMSNEGSYEGRALCLPKQNCFVCFGLCFASLDVQAMNSSANSSVRIWVLCLLYWLVCILVLILFFCLLFMTNMVLWMMTSNENFTEAGDVFKRGWI
jgi:hypothetical protein